MLRKLAFLFLTVALLASPLPAKEKYLKPGPVELDHGGEKWAQKNLRKMSLEDKVGQLFMVWARARFLNLNGPEYAQYRQILQKYHVGGFALTVPAEGAFVYYNQPYEAAMLVNQLQRESRLPLIFAADFERGVSMRLQGSTVFPHAMAFGAAGNTEYAKQFGAITAEEARAVGVEWNFFPDADVNSNPANPIINTRSFGEDAQEVGKMVTAYIQGAKANGMLTTAKHFPGHGDTATDSHLGLAKVTGDRQRLNAVELPPFEAAIKAGVDAIMVAHVTVPALEPDPNRVATTSPAIVTGLLKQQLGFKGLVITDALDMGGLTRLYQNDIGRAAVEAFKAGADMLLIPADLDASYQAMLKAVKSGEIPESRVDQSVLKILQAKASVGLNKARLVDIAQLGKVVGKPENLAFGQQVADQAVTLVRDNGQVLPLQPLPSQGTGAPKLPYQAAVEVSNRLVVVVFCDDLRMDPGHEFVRELRQRRPDANILYVDTRTAAAMTGQVLSAVQGAEKVVAAVYEIPTAGKAVQVAGQVENTVGLSDARGELLGKILQAAAPKTMVVAVGNPYVAGDFPQVANYMCTFSNASVSEDSAVKALFGEIPVRGHLPVTIPQVAQRGTGLEKAAGAAATGGNHVAATHP
ncbi:MAG: glycoside hydrolase family 3 N-terminal domain-containing protein [Acidobacteriota bacterium]